MYTNRRRRWRARIISLIFMLLSGLASTHTHWTQVNQLDPELLGLYHFDEDDTGPGDFLLAEPGLPDGRNLLITVPAGAGMQADPGTPGAIFAPRALLIQSAQSASSAATLPGLDGNLTIEFWFAWDATLTSQTVQAGLASGAKLRIARDTANPANDRFGLAFTHGDYVSAPDFTNWVDVGVEEAPLAEWGHVAVAIHSTGMYFDTVSGHDVYSTGSLARFWLNGHQVGLTPPHTVDITGMRAHDASKLTLQGLSGAIRIDELAIWNKDWSANGAEHNPFANGRGTGIYSTMPAAAHAWERYE